jgi:hypothetical protein
MRFIIANAVLIGFIITNKFNWGSPSTSGSTWVYPWSFSEKMPFEATPHTHKSYEVGDIYHYMKVS